MALIAMCSAKGSPGVTVTALAFTLSWTRRIILAECDPAGGDVAAGYLNETRLDGRGLGQLSASVHRGRLAEDLWTQMVDLAPGKGTGMTRLILPGLTDPAQAVGWADQSTPGQPAGWTQLAHLFRSLETGTAGYDVIADCGRLSAAHPPTPLLAAADAVLLVLRPTLPSMRAAAVALATLGAPGGVPVELVTVGSGTYSHKEITLELRTPLVAAMPDDSGTAAVLSNGGEHFRGRLLHAAAKAEAAVGQMITTSRTARDGQVGRCAEIREVPSVR
jgi:hypothetical protein